MNDSEKRIIVIGSERHYGVKTTQWYAEEMPNIADYEVVILDTCSLAFLLEGEKGKSPEIERGKFLRTICNNLGYIKERLLHVMRSNGNIYAICSQKTSVRIGTTVYSSFDNYDWLPFPIRLVREQGETIEVLDDSFAHYFQFVKKWSFCFEEIEPDYSSIKEIHNFYGDKYYVKPKTEVIAENRYRRPIAINLRYRLYQFENESELEKAIASVHAYNYYKKKLTFVSGQIVLLPPPTEIDSREAINVLLKDFWGIEQKTLPPEGIQRILMPREDYLKQQIQEKVDKIEELKSEISGLEIRKEEVAKFKQLLYETGQSLEDISKVTLAKLGCEVDDIVEDFILIKGDKEAIVEVKGREGSILREDGSQLAQNRRNYVVQKGKGIREVKAILLGNPWRFEFPLEERAKKEPFSRHLVKDAKVEDMALVTTVELLKAYCAFLENKVSSKEIIERLFSGIGLTKLLEEQTP